MGPYPHDAPPPEISAANPMGTDGFEFVEFTHPDPKVLDDLFRKMGFLPVARHRSKEVTLYRQGGINFIVNAEKGSLAQRFAEQHGPSAPAMAFRVVDARHAFERALSLGAKPAETRVGPMELNIPAIEGIGGLQIWLNLPAKDKMTRPKYRDLRSDLLPETETDEGAKIRVIAGDAMGGRLTGPVAIGSGSLKTTGKELVWATKRVDGPVKLVMTGGVLGKSTS